MEEAAEANRRVHQTAADSMNALRNFVHFADPEAMTPGDCAAAIRKYDALITEYRSL